MDAITKAIRGLLLGLLIFSAIVIATPRNAGAAGNEAGWVGPFSDGCSYYQDAVAAYWAACPRTDGTIGIVQAQNGAWVYIASVWIDANGYVNISYADGTFAYLGADGSESIYGTDGTIITIPPYTGECGNYCQPNYGGLYFPTDDASIWLQPRTQQEYTPGCEFPVSGVCYSS